MTIMLPGMQCERDMEQFLKYHEQYEKATIEANKELEAMSKKQSPLNVKEFPLTPSNVGITLLTSSQNTVHEYTMRYATLCCYGGFIVEYKYKDRHHLKDEVWVEKWKTMFKQWWNEGWVMPVIFSKGVMRMDQDLLDRERNQTIQLLGDNKIRVTNRETGLVLTKEAAYDHMSKYVHGSHNHPINLNRDWIAAENFKHQYTQQEIDNLTCRTMYMLWLFPSHKVNESIRVNQQLIDHMGMEEYRKRYIMSSWDKLNELTGNKWFVTEGKTPEVTFELEVPADRNWEEEALRKRTSSAYYSKQTVTI